MCIWICQHFPQANRPTVKLREATERIQGTTRISQSPTVLPGHLQAFPTGCSTVTSLTKLQNVSREASPQLLPCLHQDLVLAFSPSGPYRERVKTGWNNSTQSTCLIGGMTSLLFITWRHIARGPELTSGIRVIVVITNNLGSVWYTTTASKTHILSL